MRGIRAARQIRPSRGHRTRHCIVSCQCQRRCAHNRESLGRGGSSTQCSRRCTPTTARST